MADSIKVVDEEYVKRIHSRNPSGHIHKGHGVVAANASIPTKYQTIVTDNGDKKGFLSKSKRFQTDVNLTDNPGPGNYLRHMKVDNMSTSFSKKGTGGFASKSRRSSKYTMSDAPGPGLYSLPNTVGTKPDFNHAPTTRTFHKPIATQFEKLNGVPAPNTYEVVNCRLGKVNNVSAGAAFKSQTTRNMIDLKEASRFPAPGQYSINDSLLHHSPKVMESSFKSTSKRQMQPDPPNFPGPGTYYSSFPEDPAKRSLFPRKHYLCISAPAMPLPPDLPAPGPGTYEVVDYDGPSKHYMSSAAFVSASSRWMDDFSGLKSTLPGPAHYKPVAVGKQSFIYNSSGKWI